MICAKHDPLNVANDSVPSNIALYGEIKTRVPSRLGRVVSVRLINQNLDSSESIPSDHSSLYEAALASFESENGEIQAGQKDVPDADSIVQNDICRILSEQLDDALSINSAGPPQPQRKWPLDILETITEQRNAILLSPSMPPPSRVGPGGPIDASLAVKISQSTTSSSNPDTTDSSRRRTSFSLDDLDVRILHRKHTFRHEGHRRSDSSSSSHDSFELALSFCEYRSPVDPAQPLHPPPVRTPTPPGLPSFGSVEAMRYSAPQPSRGHPSSSQGSQQQQQQPSQIPHNTPSPDTGLGNNGNGAPASPGRSLRRLFGLSWTESHPARLAPGIVGRADDGTLVRARFGTRQSGHGIGAGPGSRGLQSHPFHRNSLPVARTHEVVQVDGSPNNSRDEGQLSQPESFAPPRVGRASSSSSQSSVPYPITSPLPQLRSARVNPRTSSVGSTSGAGPSGLAYRTSEPRLPRILEMTALSRPDNQSPLSPGRNSADHTSPSQPSGQETKGYWAQLWEMCSIFCCGVEEERDVVDPWRSRQVDGNGEGSSIRTRRSVDGSPALSRSASFTSWAPDPQTTSRHSPWRPAWGCQPGRHMGWDGADEDEVRDLDERAG